MIRKDRPDKQKGMADVKTLGMECLYSCRRHMWLDYL